MPIVELTGLALLLLLLLFVRILTVRKKKNRVMDLAEVKALPAPTPLQFPEPERADSVETDSLAQPAARSPSLPYNRAATADAPLKTLSHFPKESRLDAIIEPRCVEQKQKIVEKNLKHPDLNQMAWIEAGTFHLGSPLEEQGRSRTEGPLTEVVLSQGFWIGRYPVTQARYNALMSINPSYFTGDTELPVESVSWEDAMEYCRLLTIQEADKQKLPPGWRYRLPTEAEWEYCARAGSDTPFSYGEDPDYTELDRYAWYYLNSGKKREKTEASRRVTHPVGQKQPNAWGLYDIHGNVWEWCMDNWSAFYPGGHIVDPQGPDQGVERVRRGGSWISQGWGCRSASRGVLHPSRSHALLGFRIVLAPDRKDCF